MLGRGAQAIGGAPFDPEETAGLRELFGKGAEGAQKLLDALARENVALPSGVTMSTLERYEHIARDALVGGRDKIGVQALRLEAIHRLRERRHAPPSP